MINMQQPDPAGLFDKYQGQRRNPPANQSVVAQISQRPQPPDSIPPVSQPASQPEASSQQPAANIEKPVNPLTALYQSGLMEQAIQSAEASKPQNPLTQLYQSGFMTQSILDAEDKQYEQELEKWKQRSSDPLTVMYDVGGQLTKEPDAPARDIEQIKNDWKLGAKSLRGQELGNILHQLESGQMTPEQEGLISQYLEPELPPEIKKQLQVSRLTREKLQALQQQAIEEEQQAEAFGKESLYMNPFQIADDPRFGSQSQRTNVLGRSLAKGATANYAFAPDKDKLNSENAEEQAEERAKRLFYQKQEADYPVTALAGNILGAMAPIGATGLALRGARVAGATRNLQTSLLSANQAQKARNVIAARGTPQTLLGTLGESAATGFVYDIASRPEGSEEMNLKENLFARGTNVGLGMAAGLGFDLGLMGIGKAWRKLKQMPGDMVNKAEVKRRGKLLDDLAKKNNYDNADEMLDDLFLTTVKDESGERVRMQTEVLDALPEFKELIGRVSETQTTPKTATTPAGTTEPAPTTQRHTTGEAEAPVQRRTESPIEEAVTKQTEAPTEHKVTGGEIVEAPIDELTLSADVPQFKSGANQQGVVEQLGGTFDRTGVGPIQVWVRNDGSKEIISGRHRYDLAKRSGEKSIPAQYHYESQGFGKDQAANLDAMLNIREGQGKVRDYVDFIQNSGLTKAEADAQGILARATGRRAHTIATEGTDTLIAAYRANQLTDEAATRIASAAPNNEALQAVGIKAIQDGKTITVAENMVKAVRTMTDESAMKQAGDMFGFDDSALREAESLARKAAAKQADIQKTLSAVQGAAKNPERAAKEGVDVKDPEAVKRRIEELKQEKQDWQNWHTNPELTAQLRGEEVTPPPKASEQPKPPDQQEGFDLTTQTETELSAKAKTQQQAEAADLKQQQDLEAKARADQEAKEFELGIQGSGEDVPSSQGDMLGLGAKAQPNRQSSVKSEPKAEAKPVEKKAEAPNTITALENLDTVSAKELDQIAQLMSMPKKKKGETVRDRENRLRDVYRVFKDLSNESMESLQQKSKAELVELAKSVNKFKSRYNKTDLAGYILDWRKMVLDRMDKRQKQQVLYKSVSDKIKNNEPVLRADAEKLLGKQSGGIYTDNDIAVARILNQDKVLPPNQRSPEHRLLYELAEKLNDSAKSIDLANDLLKHPSVKELLPRINDVVNRDVLSVTVDLTPVGKVLKVPDAHINDFTSEFAGSIADSLLEAAHKANIKIPAYQPPKAPKVNNPQQKLSDIKQSFQELRDQGHPVVGKYIDLIDDMKKALDSNKPFTIDYWERYGHYRPSQVIDGYNHQSFNEYVKHLDEIAEAATRGVQRRLDNNRGNIPDDIILTGKNGNTPFLLEKMAEKSLKSKLNDGTLKGLESDWQVVKVEGGYGIKRVQPESKPKPKPKDHNPQTIEDYQKVIQENGKDSLTTAQRAEYERLNAEAQQQATQAAEPKAKPIKGLETEQALEIEPITEGTHTKTGKTIYNVKVNTKLGKQKFQEAAKQARDMGGNYYKGNFWLKTKDDARQFVDWLNGQNIDRSPGKMQQETSAANNRAGNLRKKADKLEQQGTTELNADRTTNTPRQMDQAATARSKASKKINFAQTLRNIANGIEDGSVRFLAKLDSMAQLETLTRIRRKHIPDSMMDSSYNGYSMSRQLKQGVTLEDYIDRIRIPDLDMHRDKAIELAEAMKGKRGYARLRNELDKQISIAKRSDNYTIKFDPHGEHAGSLESFRKKYDADVGWLYQQNMDEIKRLQRMGLTTDDQLRSALRELETVSSTEGVKTPKQRKLDDMRYKIKQAARSFNDFFPTPEDVVNRVLELADIRPGMKTLEPNAGMGHIARKLQTAAGKDNVDLVEMSGQLVDYLKASGHNVKQSDFLKFGEKGTYDRIVMNPPFSKDQDIDHVMHAYELLKPGGKMTAIMSNMAGLRTNKKNRAFSDWLDEVGAHVEDLEAGAFKSSFNPTSVNTKVVVIEKPLKAAKSKAKEAPSPRDEMLQRMKELENRKATGEALEVTASKTESKPLDIEKYRIGSDRMSEELRKLANEFSGQADGKSLKPLARDIAEFTIENGKRLDKADMAELARKHGVSEEVVNAISTQPFSFDGVKYASEVGNTDASDFLMKHSIEKRNKGSAGKSQPMGTTLYSSPVVPAARQVANMLHLNPGASTGGAIYGGITAGDKSESERYSPQWWLDSVFGAAAGAVAGAAGVSGLKSFPVSGKSILGKQSHAMDAYHFAGRQFKKLPGMSRGNEEVLTMGKQQQLMKALIERQSEKAGDYLLKNFTPSERATMADLIEGRGIVAEGNLLHRQAKELDDFIAYTGKKLQELGMLDADIEPGGYLHRYYSKDLGIGGLARALTPKGKTLSGSWSIRRGTEEVFDDKYMSKSMRDTMAQVRELQAEYNQLKRKSGDLVGEDTTARMDEIKAELKDLQSIEFREYLMPENGTMKSFFMAADEVPVIPKLKRTAIGQTSGKAGLNEPGKQGRFRSMDSKGIGGSADQTILTDRRWTIDGMKDKGEGILHRDWTKAERESWGEINDAAYRMVRGQAEVAHDLSLGTFYKQVDDRFSGTKVSDTEIPGWHKVPDTRVGKGSRMKKYGALSGKYVSDDVWQAIRNHGRNPLGNLFNNNPAISTYLKTLSKWKTYKTVYNPVSHINNSVGNLQMYYLSDYESKYLADAFRELRKGEYSDFVREARNNGLFGNDWTSTVTGVSNKRFIDDLLEKLRTQPEIPDFEQSLDSVMKLKQWFVESSNAVSEAQGSWKTGAELAKAVGNPLINTVRKPIDKAAKAMQTAYRMEDEFFKMAVYLAERQKGTKPPDAVKAANRYFFDYNDMPDGMKVVRDFPIGSPFISYTYFAIPSVVKTAIEKPEKLLALAAALEGINYASMAVNGELQEQGYWERMADEKELYPGWMQGRSLVGSPNNISVPFLESYKLGLANANVGGNPFVGNAERSGAWPEFMSFWGSGPEGSNPITKLLFDISRNEDWRGNPIWQDGAPNSEQVRKGMNYIYQNVTPSNPLFPGSYHQQKLVEGMANEVRSAEEEGSQPNALMNSVVDLANATSDILGGGQFTGLDRRENEILFRDALFGSIGMKLRPVRADQFEESKSYELRKKQEDLGQWIRTRERLFDENRISERQIRKDRDYLEQQFIKLDKQSDRLSEAASRQVR